MYDRLDPGEGRHSHGQGTTERRVALLSVFSNAALVALSLPWASPSVPFPSLRGDPFRRRSRCLGHRLVFRPHLRHPRRPGTSLRTRQDRKRLGHRRSPPDFPGRGWIVYEAVGKIIRPEPLEMASWGAAVMLLSAVVKPPSRGSSSRSARETTRGPDRRRVAPADRCVHLGGGHGGPGAIWAASHVAPGGTSTGWTPRRLIGVAALIVKAAWDLTRQSARDLLDVQLPSDEIAWIEA